MEHLSTPEGTKEERYRALLPQIEALLEGEPDPIARMANMAAALHETFRFWWTGFYRVMSIGPSSADSPDEELVLGPFQGPIACTRIGRGRGVCGTAWAKSETQVVPDVEQFPGHIACSSASRSEIVVPVVREGRVVAVLDIDSEHLATFDATDRLWLEQIVALL
ncbi:MAG: GAF domain-containing protein [Bacteroidaceae bacterium]|nr:GAF domain-containing protein [Bacteroidaceae bacterium]